MRVPLRLVRTAVLVLSRPLGRPVPVRVQRGWLELQARLGRVPEGTVVEHVTLGGRPAERVTCGRGIGGPAVLWLHGGAFWTCSPRTHRVLAAHLAAATGGPVLVLDHRLAPEHPHPAAVDDARAAFRELSAQGAVVLGGDSAGGAVALMLALDLRDAGGQQPTALALISPVADLSGRSASSYRGPDPLLRRSWVRDGARAYLAGADAAALSPLNRDLHGLPRLHVQLAGDERLRPEGERLVAALRAAGNDVHDEVLPGLWHDVQLQADLVPEAAEALRRLGSAVARRQAT